MENPYVIEHGSCKLDFSGFNSFVYFVSDNVAVKVSRQDKPFPKDLRKEFLIQRMIYSAGYPVPAPYGIFPVETRPIFPFSSGEKLVSEGLFMERIHGHCIGENDRICNCDFENSLLEAHLIHDCIKDRLGIQVSKEYGIMGKNVMHDRIKDRIVLIDFGNWDFLNSN